MSATTKIEWTDVTWNPVTGCTKVSPGCDHCYAETFAERWRDVPGHPFEHGFDMQLRPERLQQPLHWRKPRRVFVNSMGDLFHPSVPVQFIASVFAVMSLAPQHTFQLLTKRHGRMRSVLTHPRFLEVMDGCRKDIRPGCGDYAWPLPNVWLGVSAEDQKWADNRIPALIQTPAAVRWVSAEPLLGPIDIPNLIGALDWVVVGGESGPGARPMDPDWVHSLVSQCRTAGVMPFVKQLGAVWARKNNADPKGGNWDYWPSDLRVREYPGGAS